MYLLADLGNQLSPHLDLPTMLDDAVPVFSCSARTQLTSSRFYSFFPEGHLDIRSYIFAFLSLSQPQHVVYRLTPESLRFAFPLMSVPLLYTVLVVSVFMHDVSPTDYPLTLLVFYAESL